MKLWPHQTKAIDLIRKEFRLGKRKPLVCLPTGGGKTFLGCYIIKKAVEREGAKLIVVDREELLQQWSQSLTKFGISHGFIRRKSYGDSWLPKKVYVAMVESLWSRLKKDPAYLEKLKVNLTILDEAHKFAHFKVASHTSGKVIGLTATPLCSNVKGKLSEMYDGFVMPSTTSDLILSGHIVGSETFSLQHEWKGLKRQSNGEFSEESQMLHFGKRKLIDGLVRHWHSYAKGKQTIVYNVNVEHSKRITKEFLDSGISCEHMDGGMSQSDRDAIFSRFRSGATTVISNVHLLTTGNDEREIECIAINRKCGLISTFTQIAGRGARSHTFPDGRRKGKFVLLDMGGNYEQHPIFGEDVDWHAIFKEPGISKNGKDDDNRQVPLVCNFCGGVNPSRSSECVYCKKALEQPKKTNSKPFLEMLGQDKKSLERIRQSKVDSLPEDLKGLNPNQMTDPQLWRFIEHMGHKKSYFYVIRKFRK